jgi:hypothetical protein
VTSRGIAKLYYEVALAVALLFWIEISFGVRSFLECGGLTPLLNSNLSFQFFKKAESGVKPPHSKSFFPVAAEFILPYSEVVVSFCQKNYFKRSLTAVSQSAFLFLCRWKHSWRSLSNSKSDNSFISV